MAMNPPGPGVTHLDWCLFLLGPYFWHRGGLQGRCFQAACAPLPKLLPLPRKSSFLSEIYKVSISCHGCTCAKGKKIG